MLRAKRGSLRMQPPLGKTVSVPPIRRRKAKSRLLPLAAASYTLAPVKAEIIAIGTEILFGKSSTRTAPTSPSACPSSGIDLHFTSVVGDNMDRINATFRRA